MSISMSAFCSKFSALSGSLIFSAFNSDICTVAKVIKLECMVTEFCIICTLPLDKFLNRLQC